MSDVKCLYCGKDIPEDSEACPHCQAPSHFQRRGMRFGARRRFILLFVLLVIFVFTMAFLLPR